jgi:hypothetical protein
MEESCSSNRTHRYHQEQRSLDEVEESSLPREILRSAHSWLEIRRGVPLPKVGDLVRR